MPQKCGYSVHQVLCMLEDDGSMTEADIYIAAPLDPGVDRMDQNILAYRITIRSRKWWWPLFSYLLQVAMQNAWLVYRMTDAAKCRPLSNLEDAETLMSVIFRSKKEHI